MLRYLRFTIVLTVLITSASAYGAEGGFCDRMLCRARSLFRRGGAAPVAEAAATTATADAARFVPEMAENYTERRAQTWITQQKCLSCHTVLPYTITHFSGAGADAEGMKQIRQYIVSRVDNWESAPPWYAEKTSESKGTELIISSFFLTQAKESGAGAEERVLKTVRLMSAMQESDGAFPWLNYNLEPFESKEARTYGATLAAISYGQLSADQQAEFAPQIEKLRGYLRKTWDKNDVTAIDQLHVAWASSELDGIINKTELKQAIRKIETKQNSDGGWSINQLSKWTKEGPAPVARADASDPYATAYVLFVMKKTGLKDESGFSSTYQKGVAWLKTHQTSDGSWEMASLNMPAAQNIQFATDYASGFAWAVLKGR